jgi:isopenicillin N synthase-like dioxygenase
MDYYELPIIDLSPALDQTSTTGKVEVSRLIRKALTTGSGVFLLKNHGIPLESKQNVLQCAKQFFMQSPEEKNRVSARYSISSEGYMGFNEEQLDTDTPPDFKETFDITKDMGQDPDNPLHGPTPWPDIAGFRSAFEDYHHHMCHLSTEVMHKCLALALELPEDFFSKFFQPHQAVFRLRVLKSPPIKASQLDKMQTNVGAHTDFGFFTYVSQSHEGLEIQVPIKGKMEWHRVPAIEGTFAVNVGEMLMRWTNGKILANYHRVRNLMTTETRYSLIYFEYPSFNTSLNCDLIPWCRKGDEKKRFNTLTVGEYLAQRGWAGLQSEEGAKRWGKAMQQYQSGWNFDNV